MDFQSLAWRLGPGFFHTKAQLCSTCWDKLSKFAHAAQETDCFADGEFVLGDVVVEGVVVSFSSKGGDCIDGSCSLCNATLPGRREEVYLSVRI